MSRANASAYPFVHPAGLSAQGMTLREHYAGLAMAGIVANSRCELTDRDLALSAVSLADALIAALEAK